jgi:hypothetical protein
MLTRKLTLAFLAIIVAAAPAAHAALIRGRLERVKGVARLAAGGITVTVYSRKGGRSTPTHTDSKGMYFINVPAGTYLLEVWSTKTPTVYEIKVSEPYTDIPAITVAGK